jgi:hypothetical protein
MKIKDFISNNCDIFDNKFKQIKKNPENTVTFQIKNFDVTISYQNFKYSIKFHDNENNEIFKTLISKFSRKINFKKLNKDNWNIVFDEEDIGTYIKKLNLIHPTFFNKEKKKMNLFVLRIMNKFLQMSLLLKYQMMNIVV